MIKPKREEHIMTSERGITARGRRPGGSSDVGRPTALRGLTVGLALAAAGGLLAACGSAAPGGATSGSATSHGAIISVRSLPGVGTVLVDASGQTLYSPQQEAHGKILCTASCLSFWFPVQATRGAALRAPSGVTGKLGTIHRADNGMTQLTINGRPLYTFRLDRAPGQAHGNDYTDHFGGVSLTWHALTTSGTPAAPGQQVNSTPGYTSPGGSGY
jgi:predicted lipoprotein with Yx(FWY)xxD motif